MINIEHFDNGYYQSVVGSVDGKEVVVLNNNIGHKWGVASSTTMTWSLDKSQEYVECYSQAFAKVEEIKTWE